MYSRPHLVRAASCGACPDSLAVHAYHCNGAVLQQSMGMAAGCSHALNLTSDHGLVGDLLDEAFDLPRASVREVGSGWCGVARSPKTIDASLIRLEWLASWHPAQSLGLILARVQCDCAQQVTTMMAIEMLPRQGWVKAEDAQLVACCHPTSPPPKRSFHSMWCIEMCLLFAHHTRV